MISDQAQEYAAKIAADAEREAALKLLAELRTVQHQSRVRPKPVNMPTVFTRETLNVFAMQFPVLVATLVAESEVDQPGSAVAIVAENLSRRCMQKARESADARGLGKGTAMNWSDCRAEAIVLLTTLIDALKAKQIAG